MKRLIFLLVASVAATTLMHPPPFSRDRHGGGHDRGRHGGFNITVGHGNGFYGGGHGGYPYAPQSVYHGGPYYDDYYGWDPRYYYQGMNCRKPGYFNDHRNYRGDHHDRRRH